MSTAPKHRHRWFQFKLKTLFMLVAVLSVGLGWFNWKVERKRNELAAANKLIDRGAELNWDFHTDPDDPSLPYRLFGERWDEWMQNVIAVSFQRHGQRPDLVAEAEPPYEFPVHEYNPARQPPCG